MYIYVCTHYTCVYIQLYMHMERPLKEVHFNLSSVMKILTVMRAQYKEGTTVVSLI